MFMAVPGWLGFIKAALPNGIGPGPQSAAFFLDKRRRGCTEANAVTRTGSVAKRRIGQRPGRQNDGLHRHTGHGLQPLVGLQRGVGQHIGRGIDQQPALPVGADGNRRLGAGLRLKRAAPESIAIA